MIKIEEVKQNPNFELPTCPVCEKQFNIGIEIKVIKKLNVESNFPYPHLHLHGDPLHAMVCYVDKQLKIRSVMGIKSIEISRDSLTFGQMLKKWSNPF